MQFAKHFFRWFSLYARALLRKGFFILFFAYFVAFCFETLRPGFVSFTLSFNALLLAVVLFGIATHIFPSGTVTYQKKRTRIFAATITSCVVAWYYTQQFSKFSLTRVVTLIVVVVVVWLVLYALFPQFSEDQRTGKESYD